MRKAESSRRWVTDNDGYGGWLDHLDLEGHCKDFSFTLSEIHIAKFFSYQDTTLVFKGPLAAGWKN